MSILGKLFGFLGGGDNKMAVIDRTLIGEALVGDGNEVAHIKYACHEIKRFKQCLSKRSFACRFHIWEIPTDPFWHQHEVNNELQ